MSIFIADHYAHRHLSDQGIETSTDLLRAWEAMCQPGCDQPFCFFSTSGIHGSYSTLDDIDQGWDLDEEDEETPSRLLTIVVMLYQPRLVTTWRGQVRVLREDVPALRNLCLQSLQNILDSQRGNLPPGNWALAGMVGL